MDTVLFIGDASALGDWLGRTEGSRRIAEEVKGADGVTMPLERNDGSQFVLVYMPSFDWTAARFAVLAHELVHSAMYVLSLSGVRSMMLECGEGREPDDECLAHLVEAQFEGLVAEMAKSALKTARRRG